MRPQWSYFDGDAPPTDDHTYVDHWYVLKIPHGPAFPQSTLIPRRSDTQVSASSCQKDVVHHRNSSPTKARALKCDLWPPIIARGCARYDSVGVGVRHGASTSTVVQRWRGKEQSTGMPVKMDAEAEVKVRIALTGLMQHAVEVLGR